MKTKLFALFMLVLTLLMTLNVHTCSTKIFIQLYFLGKLFNEKDCEELVHISHKNSDKALSPKALSTT